MAQQRSPRSGQNRPRKPSSKYITTRSGNVIKIRRSLSDRFKEYSESKAKRKADRLKGLPSSRTKRLMWRLNPRRLAKYWFSRDGAIMALKVLGIAIIVFFVMTVGVFAYFRKDLPNLKDISGGNLGGSIRYYDRTGQVLLWEDYGAVKRIPVQYNDMPQSMRDATIALEDRDFYKHRGFDMKGIFRAAFNDFFHHGSTQGGSTITQQLVKLTQDWSKDRTYKRKIKELILAVELERSYSKNDILTGYLNSAPYGGIEYGVEAASENYFHKQAKDLTLDESAMLATIPKSPLYYSPYSPDFDKKAFASRQHYVLGIMEQTGKITAQQRDEALKVDTVAKVQPRLAKYDNIKAPYFVLAAKNQLVAKYIGSGSAKIGGWKVTTTLDMNLQGIAEDQVQKGLAQVRRQGGDTAAFAAEDVKTGQMVALVGGADFNDPDHGKINYAQQPLPPGSSFKPYDYTALLENNTNFGAGSVLYDSQGPLEGYPCTNKTLPPPKGQGNCLEDYDFRYPGPLTLRYALGGSRNVPAVKAMLTTGIDKTIATAQKMGLSSGYKCYDPGSSDFTKEHETQCYSSSAIGDGAYLHLDEHVHGYSTISRNGVNLPQTYILKITDGSNKTIDQWKPTSGTQAVRPDAAYIVQDMMSDPNASYFPAGRKPHRYKGWHFAMKTGTTNDGKDGWMMGFSTKYAAGVWVGYHSRTKAMSGTMENMTQPIWQGWMDRAHDNQTPEQWQKPSDLQSLPAYVIRSHVGIGSVEPSPSTDLFPSWYVSKAKTTSKQTIDRVSNKLATDCTPPKARQDITGGDASSFSGDRFNGTGGANTNATDDVHKCDDVKPSISFSISSTGGGVYQLTANVTAGTHPLNSDQFKGTVQYTGSAISNCSNGCLVTINGDGSVPAVTFTASKSGTSTITAVVTDSVLYDGTNTISTDLSASGGGGGGSPLTMGTINVGGGNTTIHWTGGNNPYTAYNGSTPLPGCTNVSGHSCTTSTVLASHGDTVTVTDSDGNSDSGVVP